MSNFRKDFDQEIVNKHYASELKKGTNLYGSEFSQTERFRNALRYFDFDGKGVLDVGCGRGDFLKYLEKNKQIPLLFIGLDPYQKMIMTAKKNPTAVVTDWVRADYVNDFEINDGVDIITAFSAFDREFGNDVDSQIYVRKAVEKMINEATEGIYVTFLSTYKNIDTPGELLFSPDGMFLWARRFAERIVLDCSYMPHAFSLIVYKQKSDWRKSWESK